MTGHRTHASDKHRHIKDRDNRVGEREPAARLVTLTVPSPPLPTSSSRFDTVRRRRRRVHAHTWILQSREDHRPPLSHPQRVDYPRDESRARAFVFAESRPFYEEQQTPRGFAFYALLWPTSRERANAECLSFGFSFFWEKIKTYFMAPDAPAPLRNLLSSLARWSLQGPSLGEYIFY